MSGGQGQYLLSNSPGHTPRRATVPISPEYSTFEEARHRKSENRLRSLDVFRGMAILGMIIVDNQGNFNFVYEQFSENFWNGLRFCNLVFPSFLFIMGVSLTFTMKRKMQQHDEVLGNVQDARVPGAVWKRVIVRSLILFVIGVFLNLFASQFDFSSFRIMGILQRIALSYAIVAVVYLTLSPWPQRLVIVGLVTIYMALLYAVDVPGEGCGRGVLTEKCNTVGYFDRQVFGRHFMHFPSDPEGLLSTFMSCVNVYFGVETGRVLQRVRARYEDELLMEDEGSSEPRDILWRWAAIGLPPTAIGYLISLWIPLNKKIWSLSFTMVSSGISLLFLAILYFLVDVWFKPPPSLLAPASPPSQQMTPGGRTTAPGLAYHALSVEGSRHWFGQNIFIPVMKPFIWLGQNPLLVFVLMVIVEILLLDTFQKAYCDGCPDAARIHGRLWVPAWDYIYWKGFASWISDWNGASMLVAVLHALVWTLFAGLLARKKWFLSL